VSELQSHIVERRVQLPSYSLAAKDVDATIKIPPHLASTYKAKGENTKEELVDRQRSRFLQECNLEPELREMPDDEDAEDVDDCSDGESSDDEA